MTGSTERGRKMSVTKPSPYLPALEDSSAPGSPGPSGFDKSSDERISLDDIHAVLDWCARLDCTEDQLRDAVRKAGPRLQGVKRELGKGLYEGPVASHLSLLR